MFHKTNYKMKDRHIIRILSHNSIYRFIVSNQSSVFKLSVNLHLCEKNLISDICFGNITIHNFDSQKYEKTQNYEGKRSKLLF